MYKKKLEDDIRCPLEYGLAIFGGKWKSRIICVLAAKETLRYSQIRKEMYNITDAVLAATLKEMITDEIVERKSYDEIPPSPDFAEYLSVSRYFLQGRYGEYDDTVSEM